MTFEEHLRDKIVAITGANRGLGAALAAGFAEVGSRVAVLSRELAAGELVAEAIQRKGGLAIALPCDVTQTSSVEGALDGVVDVWGPLDVVIANAGVDRSPENIVGGNEANWRQTIETNVIGVYQTIRAAIPRVRVDGGTLIVVGSGLGTQALPGRSAYSASKAAVTMIVKTAAIELRQTGIVVHELIPGPVLTDMLKDTLRRSSVFATEVAGEDFKEADAVVPLAQFLASGLLGSATGQSYSLMRR